MPHRLCVLLCFVLYAATAVGADTYRISGSIHRGVSRVEVVVTAAKLENGFSEIKRVEIRQKGELLQDISFGDDDMPTVREPGEAAKLVDVDCDGYKDLLVVYTVGVHGDEWYHLFRFIPSQGKFVRYQKFSQLPVASWNCQTKIIHTYVNSGAAGCAMEAGEYRWVNGDLVPLWTEQQSPDDGTMNSYTRTKTVWKNGKPTVEKRKVTARNCANE